MLKLVTIRSSVSQSQSFDGCSLTGGGGRGGGGDLRLWNRASLLRSSFLLASWMRVTKSN